MVTHYSERLRALWTKEDSTITGVEIVVQPTMTRLETAPVKAQIEYVQAAPAHAPDDFGAPLDPRYRFDNFVVGKPNEFAHAAARRVAEVGARAVQPVVPPMAASVWVRPI